MVPVSDVDKARDFYQGLGWRLDADLAAGPGFRVVQLTRPARRARSLSAPGSPRQVRHERVPLEAIGNPDMHAMWSFLNGPGYRVDIAALHAAHPEIAWTSFAEWAQHTFGAARSYPRRFFGDASVRGECLLSPGARAATTGGTCRSI